MDFGVVTQRDIASEMAARGITISTGPPVQEPVISPPVVIPPPEAPEQPVTVSPQPALPYEPYIPVYPPPVVSPEDVTEEIVPYVPGTTQTPERKLDKGLLILMGITAFALVALAKPKTGRAERQQDRQKRSVYPSRRRF